MNSKKSLIYGQALIFLIIFVSFGVIIISEKGQFLFSKKINENNLLNLKFYCIEKEITINSFDSYTITNEIIKNINNLLSNNITPKYYEFTFINKNDITTSLKLSNIKEDFITNTNNINLINEILKDNKEIKKYTDIKYEYTK